MQWPLLLASDEQMVEANNYMEYMESFCWGFIFLGNLIFELNSFKIEITNLSCLSWIKLNLTHSSFSIQANYSNVTKQVSRQTST